MAITRSYARFYAFVPTLDAAIFAGQSMKWGHDGVTREDSTGTFSQPMSRFRGRYLRIAPAGLEGRPNRVIVKGAVGPELAPGVILDPEPAANLGATLTVTERGLMLP